jgi:RNA polymerase sigma-70 factor (ECF subfamily)
MSEPEQSTVFESVDHLFRHHSGQMVSVLSRIFGLEKLDMVEDAVQSTEWERILACYEDLAARKFSPVVELNRMIVHAKVNGYREGLEELIKFGEDDRLKNYNLFYVTMAHFLAETGDTRGARASYEKAIELTRNEPVRRFLSKKIENLG